MHRVRLVGSEGFRFPQVCCCCLSETDSTMEVHGGRSTNIVIGTVHKFLTLEVPCCPACKQHASWYADLGIFGKTLKTAFVVLAGAALWWLVVWQLSFEIGGESAQQSIPRVLGPLGAIVAIVLGIYYLRRQWLKRPAPLGQEHVSRWTPVKVLVFKGGWVELGLRNETYAVELVRLNSEPSDGATQPS